MAILKANNSFLKANGKILVKPEPQLSLIYLNYFEDASMVPEISDPDYTDIVSVSNCSFVPGYFGNKNAIYIPAPYGGYTYYRSQSMSVTKDTTKIEIIFKGITPYDLSATGIDVGPVIIQLLGRELNTSNFVRIVGKNKDPARPVNLYNGAEYSALNDSTRFVIKVPVQPDAGGWHKVNIVNNYDTLKAEFFVDDTLYGDYYMANSSYKTKYGLRVYSETYTYGSIFSLLKVEQF